MWLFLLLLLLGTSVHEIPGFTSFTPFIPITPITTITTITPITPFTPFTPFTPIIPFTPFTPFNPNHPQSPHSPQSPQSPHSPHSSPFIPIIPIHLILKIRYLESPKNDGIFFTAGFSNFSVVVTHVLANWLFNKLSYKKIWETLANKFLSCHKSLQYTYHETLKAAEICIKICKFVSRLLAKFILLVFFYKTLGIDLLRNHPFLLKTENIALVVQPVRRKMVSERVDDLWQRFKMGFQAITA